MKCTLTAAAFHFLKISLIADIVSMINQTLQIGDVSPVYNNNVRKEVINYIAWNCIRSW